CVECRKEIDDLAALDQTLSTLVQEHDSINATDSSCPDAMTLAQYLSGSLPASERETVETHLSRCQPCLDELVATDDQLESIKTNKRATPVHLLNQAMSIVEKGPKVEAAPTFLARLREWSESLLAAPRWALAGAGACAIVLLAFYLTRQA